jgi:hypothetical protein
VVPFLYPLVIVSYSDGLEEVEFEWRGEAGKVLLTGSFLDWDKNVALESAGDGVFKVKQVSALCSTVDTEVTNGDSELLCRVLAAGHFAESCVATSCMVSVQP